MIKYIISILIALPLLAQGQSLGKERVDLLDDAVVRIFVDTIPSGTGFFITESGFLTTCFHVIEKALIYDNLGKVVNFINISAEFTNGEKVELAMNIDLINKKMQEAVVYDNVLLKAISDTKTKFNPLKIGSWENISDGDQIYSCGYPLGIDQRFISQGILSTKFNQLKTVYFGTEVIDNVYRNVAWLDITMNPGNSGGPVIKRGSTPEEDEVIGIATFILNPSGIHSKNLIAHLDKHKNELSIGISNIDIEKTTKLFATAIANNSIGVSGCISIDYIDNILQLYAH